MNSVERDAVEALKILDTRWPGFFDLVRSYNGFEVEGFGYEDLLRLNEVMLNDEEGMELLVRSLMALMKDEPSPLVAEWLESVGFLSKDVIDLRDKLADMENKIQDDSLSVEERAELFRELDTLKAKANIVKNKSAQGIGRSFMGLQIILEDNN